MDDADDDKDAYLSGGAESGNDADGNEISQW